MPQVQKHAGFHKYQRCKPLSVNPEKDWVIYIGLKPVAYPFIIILNNHSYKMHKYKVLAAKLATYLTWYANDPLNYLNIVMNKQQTSK